MSSAAALLAVLGAPVREPSARLPRTVVVFAHPDDETVGAGARLPWLAEASFVCVTDGAPRDGMDAARHGLTPAQYAQARRAELEAVLAACGVAADRIVGVPCPDQQASLQLASLATQLAELFARNATEAVLTQPYEGGHPDHDATAFAVHAAAALMRQRGQPAPEIVEMAGYHRGPQGMLACAFLPDPEVDGATVSVRLTPGEQDFRRHLVALHATQQGSLWQFPHEVERFRPAPRYDFRQPPHAGPLHYEQYPWGMTGERFRTLASGAMAQLGLEGRL